tara:strand:+ start:533 stop:3367 length:2835 start_codon:yes stop_codon:yes gene_type:complete
VANYNVDIEVGLKGLNRLQQFKRELEGVDTAYLNIISVTKRLEKQGGLKKFYEGGREQLLKLAGDQMKLDSLLKQGAEIRAGYAKDRQNEQQKLAAAEREGAAKSLRMQKEKALAENAEFNKQFANQNKINKLFADAAKIRKSYENDRIAAAQRQIKLEQDLAAAKIATAKAQLVADQKANKERLAATAAAERQIATRNKALGGGKTGRQKFNAAITGGAFPLLFGGGAGQALGGLIGGGLSGEMFSGLTVGLQVLGSAVDRMIASARDLGSALDPISGDFEAVAEAAGYANTEILEHIRTIEDLGKSNRALEIATEKLKRTVGADGVQALQSFGQASKDLANSTAQVASQAFASIAAALEPLTRAAANFLRTTAVVGQAQVSEDPRVKAVRGEIKARMQTYGNQFGGVDDLENRRAIRELRRQELELIEKINKEAQAAIIIEANNLRVQENVKNMNLKTLEQYELETRLVAAGNDLSEEKVQTLHKEQIELDFKIEKQDIIDRLNNKEITARAAVLALKGLENDKTKSLADLQERINRALGKGAKDSQKTAEQRARELKEAQDLAKEFEREVRLRTAGTEVARDLLEIQFQHEDRIKQINELENQSLATQQKKNAEALKELQIRERLAAFATTKTEGEQSRDDINRENSLLAARLQGREKEFLLNERINELGKDFRNDLETQQDLQDRITGKEFAEQQQKQIRSLEAIINGTEEQFELQQKIQEIEDLKLTTGEAELIINQQKIADLEKQAELIQQQRQFYEQVGATIQSGIVNGIMSALDGSKSLSESLSGLLKQVGGMFLNVGIGALGQSMGIPGFKPFAQGGYVSSPTRALVGEGGQGEYVIPENKMRESMARYSRGARGSAVVPEAGASGTSGEGGGTAVAAPIDVRFNVERINNVDYVTAEQFQVGLTRAAQQGAAEGERRAMGSLRNSAAVRRRIGV